MILVRSRLGFVIACLAVAFICWAVVYLPPYEKIVYANSPVLSQEEADERDTWAIGYKGGEDIDRIMSTEDFLYENRYGFKNVILEIDTKKMEETGIYQSIKKTYQLGDIEENKMKVFFLRSINNYGQFYVATLESGERILVFINDSLVNVKEKGVIRLPIGKINMSSIDFEKYDIYQLWNNNYILDCASGFATGPEMQDFRFMEIIATVILVVAMIIVLVIVCGINFGKSLK